MDFLNSLISNADLGIIGLIFILGIAAFLLSTISGGGGSLVLVPFLNWILGVTNTAPVLIWVHSWAVLRALLFSGNT